MAVETTTSAQRSGARGNGQSDDRTNHRVDVTVAAVPGRRQRRPIWVVGGLLCVALAALVGALLFSSLTTTVSVLAADTVLEPGQIVTANDLRVVELSNLGDAAIVRVEEQSTIVGSVARGPIPAGTVLSRGLFGDRGTAVAEGMAVVGTALEAGAVPGSDLQAGDRVVVLGVGSGLSGLDRPADSEALVLAEATVWAVEHPGGGLGGRTVVSLLIPIETQTVVAQAAADDRIRLSLVSG